MLRLPVDYYRLLSETARMFLVGLATIMTIMVITIIWQQAQLRYFRDLVAGAMRPAEAEASAEPAAEVSPQVGHFETEQLFFRGQTRH